MFFQPVLQRTDSDRFVEEGNEMGLGAVSDLLGDFQNGTVRLYEQFFCAVYARFPDKVGEAGMKLCLEVADIRNGRR